MGATHTCRSLMNATRSPRGDTAGAAAPPSASSFGSPPSKGTDQTPTVGATGLEVGFTGT